eukprot:14214742-Alexandrium_andersonii.AAC.1
MPLAEVGLGPQLRPLRQRQGPPTGWRRAKLHPSPRTVPRGSQGRKLGWDPVVPEKQVYISRACHSDATAEADVALLGPQLTTPMFERFKSAR